MMLGRRGRTKEEGVPANFKGKKGVSGRKSKAEELECFRKEIQSEELAKIARRVIGKRLMMLEEQDGNIAFADMERNFALPIALKDMGDKIKGDIDNPLIIQTSEVDEDTFAKIIQSYGKRKSKSGTEEGSPAEDI